MDTLTGIRIFCSVAERGSFTAAARHLDLSTALVSKHVMRLEARLGARLLHRSSRHVRLTEAGSAYFNHCREMLETLDEAEAALINSKAQPSGTLKLSAPVWMANPAHVAVLADFQAQYPEVRLDIDLSGRLVNLVEEGYDLALRVSPALGDTLIARTVGSVGFLLVGAPAYLRRHGRPETAEALLEHPMLSYALHPLTAADVGIHTAGAAFRIALQSGNENLLHLAARQGMGLVLLPEPLVREDVANGTLEVLTPLPTPRALPLHAVYASRRQLPMKVRHFIDFLCADGRLGPVIDPAQ